MKTGIAVALTAAGLIIRGRLKALHFKITPREGSDLKDIQMEILPFFNCDKQLDIMQKASKFTENKASKIQFSILTK